MNTHMSHRIDIELTSQAGESWNWRAAGARQPKGTLDASLLYEGAALGDVVRAEAERNLDGATLIVAVTPPKTSKARAETLEVVGRPHEGPNVSVSVTYADRPAGGRAGARPGGPRRNDRPERGERPPREGRTDREGRPDRGPRPERGAPAQRPDRPARPPLAERPDRPPRTDRPDRPEKTFKQRKLNPTRAHRSTLLESLPIEQQAIAEQLFRGGIPAVRQAIIDQNAELRAVGHPEMPAAPLLAMADALLPKTKQADWLDHAQAALDLADDISLRDLRAVVTQADGVTRDDASREMAAKLREALQRRIEGERVKWNAEIASAVDEKRLIRAVRLAGKLPDPGAKLTPELQERLVSETNTFLSPEMTQDQWAALIEAAADSPFRREIVPVGLPAVQSDSFKLVAAQASNRIPSLLKLLGLTIPPPPRRAPVGSKS